MKYSISCASGLESVLKKEIEIAGYKVFSSQPTLVRCEGDLSAIAKINLRSRVGNKVFLELGQHITSDFNALFDLVQTIDWAYFVQGNPIVVTAMTKQSVLTSTPTIQSIVKKSIVKKILGGKDGQLPEDHSKVVIEILVHIERDMCTILLNTTGESLHKRGYKKATGDAPINEALAAGLLLLSGWKFNEPLYDLFCGSGTIAIEAALIAKNIAPGYFRNFAFEQFDRYDPAYFEEAIEFAKSKMMLDKQHTIIASDIDPNMIAIAEENARHAGVFEFIRFETKDITDYLNDTDLTGCMVTNPPYGLRLNIFDLQTLYTTIAKIFATHPKMHGGIITAYQGFEPENGGGTRKQSIFMNGGEKCRFYKKTLLK